jgi:hypothetical protein
MGEVELLATGVTEGCVEMVELVTVTIGGNIYVVLGPTVLFPLDPEVLTMVVSMVTVPFG